MPEGQFLGGKGRPIVKYRDTAVSCAKTVEPIKMLFGTLSGVGPGNHILDGVQIPMQRCNF